MIMIVVYSSGKYCAWDQSLGFFRLRSLAVFWFCVLVYSTSSGNKSAQHNVCKLEIVCIQFWDKCKYKLPHRNEINWLIYVRYIISLSFLFQVNSAF